MMKYKSFLALSLIIFILACSILLFLFFTKIPKMAEDVFGPAGDNLDFSQKLIYSTQLLMFQDQLITSRDSKSTSGLFEILQGETATSVSERLFHEGYIENPDALRIYLQYSGLDSHIRTGVFKIDNDKNALEIVAEICDLTPGMVDFIIFPGLRVEEVAELLPTSGLDISEQEFLYLVNHPAELPLPEEISNIANLEGYLFPGKYQFNRDINVHDFLSIIVSRFLENLTAEVLSGFKENGMDYQQGITLASIIQREGIITEERKIIASVFLNRLERGMPLQSDPTVQYALGRSNNIWWKVPLTLDDLKIESPFNTYIYSYLPPKPICSPDLDSIIAAAFPEETDFLYFQALCDNSGKHIFVETFQEQIENLCE